MKKITDKDVIEMINGSQNPNFLRDGLCSKDVSNIDMSELDIDNFLHLSFDENTFFSKEQIDKFNPFEILEKCKNPGKEFDEVHNKGFTGKGINVAIIDSNIKNDYFNNSNVTFINKEHSGEEEEHGYIVLSSFLTIAPDANITYYCDNKYDKNRDENIKKYIQDIIKSGNIQIISMSSTISDKKIKDEIDMLLKENNITLIDSEKFNNDFCYYFRNINNGECEKDYVVSDKYQIIEEIVRNIEKVKKEFNIIGNTEEDFNRFIDILSKNENYKEDVEKFKKFQNIFYDPKQFIKDIRQKEIDTEISEREKKELLEFPCGGSTFFCGDHYKYFSTSSVSYSIPKVTALFAIAKEINNNITYEVFLDKLRETSINIDNRKIISPSNFVKIIENKFRTDLSNMVVKDSNYLNNSRKENIAVNKEYKNKEI